MTFEAPKTWEEWKNERSAREQRHFCLGVFTYLCKVGTTKVERYVFGNGTVRCINFPTKMVLIIRVGKDFLLKKDSRTKVFLLK